MNTKIVVVLGVSSLSVPELIEKSRHIVNAMSGNDFFGSPQPELAFMKSIIDELEVAYIKAQSGGTTETQTMYTKRSTLEMNLKVLGIYVENIANNDIINAETIVASSGFSIKKDTRRVAKEIDAVNTESSGEVRLSTKSENRATFEWQMTTNPDDESKWVSISNSTRSTYIKQGLISGTRYYFRVQLTGTNGSEPWRGPIDLVVL